MHRSVAILLLSLSASTALGGELRKPYFAATAPGSYARYESSSPGSRTEYTYRRLPDREGRAQIELKAEFLEGPGSGTSSTSRSTMPRGFDVAGRAIDFLAAVEDYAFVGDDGVATPLPAATVTAIREGASNYAHGFKFEEEAQVEGRKTDRYTYRAPSGGAAPTVDEGQVWLDATVPFGIVRQVGTIKNKAGAVQSTYTMRLVDSGHAAGEPARAVEAPDPPDPVASKPAGPLLLKDAFAGEKVKLLVEVVAGSAGKRLAVTMVNKTETEVRVLVPKGRSVLAVGSPLETLTLVSAEARTVTVPAGGEAAPVDFGQAGERGAVAGKFDLSVYEGTPLFSGSVTSGNLAGSK